MTAAHGMKHILETPDYVVASEYELTGAGKFLNMTESAIERRLLDALVAQGYEEVDVRDPASLRSNLRGQLERLNGYVFTEDEWERFFREQLANPNEGIREKTARLQVGSTALELVRDDDSRRNIRLLDKENLGANRLQVTNQYATKGVSRANRYDVTILVNGLPMVQVELKQPNVDIRDAFNQIERYQEESFGADDGLFNYVQLFVISNGLETKYYGNTTRDLAVADRKKPGKTKKSSASFAFTSNWADERNTLVHNLDDFTKTFFEQRTLLHVLAKYCVFTAEESLMVMRPYQIAATERVVTRVRQAIANNWWNSTRGGGFVWHTTGSGKTLTSFKTAQLVSRLPGVDKVLFVVDRKDLDYQTIKEYERFEKGAANSSSSSKVLRRQLENRDEKGKVRHYPIIVTTIQKLQALINSRNTTGNEEFFSQGTVFIFDECHRSQFGQMHADICKFFKRRLLFGFTGTPIFPQNSPSPRKIKIGRGREKIVYAVTTEQVFGEKLHTYNIIDAIEHHNVLKFRYAFVSTVKGKDAIDDYKVPKIDAEKALTNPKRIANIVRHILKHYDHETCRDAGGAFPFKVVANVAEQARNPRGDAKYELRNIKGFNAMFAVGSTRAVKLYYRELQKQLGDRFNKSFKVGVIFSYAPNAENAAELGEYDGGNDALFASVGELAEENSDNTDGLDEASKAFLRDAVDDYNKTFRTNYTIDGESFANYYKDLSRRVKNREVDLLLVVDMFLTGFDAPALNTLWLDKNLRYHGLLQAFSRTNRILNPSKAHGNIVSFRNLKQELDDSLALFGNRDASGVVLLRPYEDYAHGYEDEHGRHERGYFELAEELRDVFADRLPIDAEEEQREFVKAFNAILRLRSILYSFDEFEGQDSFTEEEFNNFKAEYLRIRDALRPGEKTPGVNINDDLVFEMELVADLDVSVAYIIALAERYARKNGQDKLLRGEIRRAVDSSVNLRSKKELVEAFLDKLNAATDVEAEWRDHVAESFHADLGDLVREERLNPEKTRDFIESALQNADLDASPESNVSDAGLALDALLPKISRFAAPKAGPDRNAVKKRVLAKLRALFEKFKGIFELDDDEK